MMQTREDDRQQNFRFRRRKLFYVVVPCFVAFSYFLGAIVASRQNTVASVSPPLLHGSGGRTLHQVSVAEDVVPECIPPSIDSFPSDFFTQEQRAQGGVVVHFLILAYLCAMLAVICDDFFVPSLEIISDKLKLPSDVAGATFMAIGTSSPELFSSIIGSFITKGDIGIGTIVGSAVFNILGVTGLAGIVLWNTAVDLSWYPVTRDCSVYVVTIAALTIIISNNIVLWWEALIMTVMFGMYIVLMYFNASLERFSQKQASRLKENWSNQHSCCCCSSEGTDEERSPLLSSEQTCYAPELTDSEPVRPRRHDSYSVDILAHESKDTKSLDQASDRKIEEEEENNKNGDEEDEDLEVGLCSPPKGVLKVLWWLVMWPASLVFLFTVPDCRRSCCRKFFVLTFLSASVWIGALSYLSVWMVTVIGYTLGIPDTVSGLTLLAVGTSLPEILTSVIIVRSGLGNMVMANLIGSNIFDILFCLGFPWLVRTLQSGDGYLVINSSALTYTTTTLLTTVIILLIVFHCNSWKLDRTMGLVCLLLYLVFIALACMYELNVFGEFNPPPC